MHCLPMADAQLATEAGPAFKKLGLDIRLGAKVSAAVPGKDGVSVRYCGRQGRAVLACRHGGGRGRAAAPTQMGSSMPPAVSRSMSVGFNRGR